MSRIPLKYHTNIKLYAQYTHPTLICRGTHGRTENIYSIFRDKLLLLGEHVLGDVSEYGGVARTMIVEDPIKVGSKHCHIFFAIGGKFTICHFHCHLSLLFMVDSSASSKKTDIFPCNMWV